MINLVSLKITTIGVDNCEAVLNTLSAKEIDLCNVVSLTTDGAPSMTGKEYGFVNLFKKHIGHSVLGFHCIIHQQASCAKTGFQSLEHILILVTKIVNFIASNPLNKRKFSALLTDANSEYNGLLMYNNVRWLSRGNLLERFVACFDEIRIFLHNENKIDQFKVITNVQWISKLMFYCDFCKYFNDLNIKLQGLNKTVLTMYNLIQAFQTKLQVFKRDIASHAFKYFPNLKLK